MKEEKSIKKENTTMFGEQVCSEFAWLPLDKQKENAEKLSKITNKKREKLNNNIDIVPKKYNI